MTHLGMSQSPSIQRSSSLNEYRLRQLALKSLPKITRTTKELQDDCSNSSSGQLESTPANNGKQAESDLRKKALMSFAKRQGSLSRSSMSSPSLESLPIVATSQRLRFVIRINVSSDQSSDSSDGEEQPCAILRRHRDAAQMHPSSSFSYLPAASTTASHGKAQFHLDTSLVRRVQTSVTSSSDVVRTDPSKPADSLMSTNGSSSTQDLRERTPSDKIDKKVSTISLNPFKRLVLKQSMQVEHLKTILKHRRKAVDERKKSVISLGLIITRLKMKLRETTKIYRNAKKLVSDATQDKFATMRELVKSECELKRMSTAVERLSRRIAIGNGMTNRRLAQPTPPEKPTLTQSLRTLSAYFEHLLTELELSFRISSPLFHHFNLFALSANMPEEVEMTPASPEISRSSSPAKTTSFDPNTPICPFFLDGSCVDKSCTFQHPGSGRFSALAPQSYTSSTTAPSISYTVTDCTSLCPVCSAQLFRDERPTPTVCSSLLDWHTVFANCHDWTPFLTNGDSYGCVRESSSAFLKHLLYANLVSTPTPVDVAVSVLSRYCFPKDLFLFVMTTKQLCSYAAQKELIQQSLSCLLSLKHRTLASSVGCMNSIAVVVYHDCRLEWDTHRSVSGIARLDQLLKPQAHLPRYHPARWALWYIRAMIEFSPTFPRCLDYCPLISPEVLASSDSTLFFQAAADDLGLSTKGLSQFLTECHRGFIPITEFPYALSFSHLYVQFLAAKGRYREGAFLCLDALMSNPEVLYRDNLFFPTAIYLSNMCLQRGETDVFDFVSEVTNHHSMQTSFAYCFACLMLKANKPEPCSSLLSELVGGLVHLNSLDAASVYYAFRVLLNLGDTENRVQSCDPKNRAFLWMGFGLFSMLHNFSSTLLPDFVNRAMTCLSDFSASDFPCPLAALLMHLGLALANMLPNAEEYSVAVEALLFPKAFTENADFCAEPPTWFLEVIQNVNVDKFSDDYPPNPVFTRVLETYGYRVLKALTVGGILRGEKFEQSKGLRCLQNLCYIARLEEPADEEFWLFIAALGFRFHPPVVDGGIAIRGYLADCFSTAVSLVPQSATLWRHYAVVVRDGDFDREMRSCVYNNAATATSGMAGVVKEVFAAGAGQQLTDALASPRPQSWWKTTDDTAANR